jgi:methionyl-tRNA synthetase
MSKEFAIDDLSTAIRSHMALSTSPEGSPSSSDAAAPAAPAKDGPAPALAAPAVAGGKDEPKAGGGGYDRWALRDESTVEYGYLSKTGGTGIREAAATKGGGFYLTTAINYTNGPAHMGHAYEGTTSDVISRYRRLKGDQPCYFVTGADEHGQKIAATAEAEGKEPQQICDKVRWTGGLGSVSVVEVLCFVPVSWGGVWRWNPSTHWF